MAEVAVFYFLVGLFMGYVIGKSKKVQPCEYCEEKAIHIGALSKEIEDLETSASENEVKIGVYERVHR